MGDHQVAVSLADLLAQIEAQRDLAEHLKTGEVRGVLWIVRLHGADDTPMPVIVHESIARATALKLRIFLENYTQFDADGIPTKLWLA